MITAYEFLGTNSLFDINGVGVPGLYNLWQSLGLVQAITAGMPIGDAAVTSTFMCTGLNPNLVKYVLVPYSAAVFPLATSITQGVTLCENLINSTPGQFVLFGWSQGGMVASTVYEACQSGSLSARNADLLGGACFGNPRRQAGHTFPLCPDPGGAGVMFDDLLATSESRWFEFANPGDLATVNDHSTLQGQLNSAVFEIFNANWDGTQTVLQDLLTNPIYTVADLFSGIVNILWSIGDGPHLEYGSYAPLAPSDTRNCAQIAIDYFHALALGWNASTTAPTATATSGGTATVEVAEPTASGTYTYTVKQFNVTTSTLSTATLSGNPSITGGNVTLTVTGLTVGDHYTFAVELGTTYSNPAVDPLSMASNQITAIA